MSSPRSEADLETNIHYGRGGSLHLTSPPTNTTPTSELGSPHDDCQSTVLSSVFQISAASTAGGVVCGPAVAASLIPTSTSPPVLSISEVTNTLLDQ